jgi:hypothetical protein
MDSETVFTPDVNISKPALIFPENLGNLSEITNVLLISSEITDYSVFYDSVNSNTLPIVYHPFTSTKDEVSVVLHNLSSIQRIGVVFHSSSGSEKMFLDGKSLFIDSDITDSGNYSENVTWLLQVVQDYNVKNIDFLACDNLNYSNWVSYFDLLHKETGVIIGASNDKTGNIKYGGDWVMESTGEDIELVYFTSSIEYYKYLLEIITVNGIKYDVNSSTLVANVSINFSLSGSIVIPSTISYSGKTYNVTGINDRAFNNCNFTSISLPTSLTTIGDTGGFFSSSAFYQCTNLETITIPNNVTTMYTNFSFYYCTRLKSVSLPDNLTNIGDSMFFGCSSLTSLKIPDSVTTISSTNAFYNCSSLTSLTFPIGISTLNLLSFNNCTLLKNWFFKHVSRLPTFVNFDSYLNNTAYYKVGVLPPVGYGSNTVGYLNNNGFKTTIAVGPESYQLSSITVNGISVQSGSTTLVKNTVTEAIVVATAADSTSTVTVTGNPILTLGVNTFQIIVTSSVFGDTATYYVYVFRLEPNCFLEGTKILCLIDNEEKYIPIETMRNGTLVKTLASGYKQVEMIGHSTIYNPGNNLRFKDRLFKCSKNAYPELTEDLILTGCHSILVGYLTEEQRKLSIELTRDIYVTEDRYRLIACLDDRAQPYEEEGVHKIWHVALENPNIYENYGIFANGLLVESMSIRMMINFSGKELVL